MDSIDMIERFKLCKTVGTVSFSGIADMINRANAMTGDLIRLEIGDVDFDPPRSVAEGVRRAFAEKKTHYPPFRGDIILLERILDELRIENKCNINEEEVLVTQGGSMGLYIALQTLLNSGDEVLLPEPIWPHLKEMITLANGLPVPVPLDSEDGFRLTSHLVEKFVTPRTKLILINTPTNPSGTVYGEEEIKGIVRIADQHGLAILCDEEYLSFRYGGRAMVSPANYYSATVTSRSFSKTLAVSGMRVGYLFGPSRWIQEMRKWSLFSSMYGSSVAQFALGHALSEKASFTSSMVEVFERRMLATANALNRIDGIRCTPSEGSVYLWPDCRKICSSDVDLANDLLNRARVVTVPGSVFGRSGHGFLRLSLGASEETLLTAVSRIEAAVRYKEWKIQ